MRAALLALALLTAASAFGADSSLFLHVQRVDVRAKAPLVDRSRLRIGIPLTSPLAPSSELSKRLKGAGPDADGLLWVDADASLESSDVATAAQKKPTFVVDIDQPVFQELRTQLPQQYSAEAVRAFVHGYIRDVNFTRGFDIASVVAARRAGDCTEHAVLSAAVARMLKRPSRVVIGMVVVWERGGTQVGAYGHAWAEVSESKGHWTRVDAALPPEMPALYLPFAVIADEGPGFAISAAQGLVFMPKDGLVVADR